MLQAGVFAIDRRLERISHMGDPLEELAVDTPPELSCRWLEKVL
ncbi:MAG: hypothetical protein PVJ30_09305 [Thiohalocapsa sp.]|jgi:hypothetical protein